VRANATYDDANLNLRLYELRRDERLRGLRAWFSANFKVKTLDELQKLCPTGGYIAWWNSGARRVQGVLQTRPRLIRLG